MLLLTQSFCHKVSIPFSFHQEWIKHIFLCSACLVSSRELKFIDAKAVLIPKPLKRAEATSAETWHWPKPFVYWNIEMKESYKDPHKLQSVCSRLSWAVTDNKWRLDGRDCVLISQFPLSSKWLSFKPIPYHLPAVWVLDKLLKLFELRFNMGKVANLLALWPRAK